MRDGSETDRASRPRVRRRGITLIEVMLASLILSVGLTMLLTVASRCLAVMRGSAEYQRAQWVRDIGNLEHPLIFAEDIREQGVDGEDYDGYTFSREIDDDDDEDGLYVVRTRVQWGGRDRSRFEEVVHLVYQLGEEND